MVSSWFCSQNQNKKIALKINEITLADGSKIPCNSFVVTFVGTFTGLFDYFTCLEVARDFSNSNHNQVHFLFIGDGDKSEYLRKHAEDISNVHFAGWCEKNEVAQFLSISSVGLAPYTMKFKRHFPINRLNIWQLVFQFYRHWGRIRKNS
jgi:glycosyltransferase involved in cell wall biosynthesis